MEAAQDDVVNTPVTDAEQWSDETERSSDETGSNAPPELQGYEALGGEDDESLPAAPGEGWREGEEDGWEDEGDDQRGDDRGDVASLLLRAMDTDYQACIDSERIASNGSVDVAFPVISNSDTERLESEGVAGHERGDEQEIQWNLGDDVDQDGGEVDGVGKAAVEVPPRPISPLGRDQAERVMRAMQGFALSAPPIPPPRFEANWESAGAVTSLSLGGSDGERKEGVSTIQDGRDESSQQ